MLNIIMLSIEHVKKLVATLTSVLQLVDIEDKDCGSAEALASVIRLMTILGGDLRQMENQRTLSNYLPSNAALVLPSHIPVLFKAQV